MPLYVYEHVAEKGRACKRQVELMHSPGQRLEICPACGNPVRKIVARVAYRRNVLSAANIREKGFTRLRRRDHGVYEKE